MSRRLPERVRIDAEVVPNEPTKIVRWGLRYGDGQVLWVADEIKGRTAVREASEDDPCVLVTRTITVTATEWVEPSTLADVLSKLDEANAEMKRAARGRRGRAADDLGRCPATKDGLLCALSAGHSDPEHLAHDLSQHWSD